MGGNQSSDYESDWTPPPPCLGDQDGYRRAKDNLSNAANTANTNLDSVTQSVDDYRTTINTLYSQIQNIEYWYYTTIPNFIGSGNEATEAETRRKSDELDYAYQDLENSRSILAQQKKYLNELKNNTKKIHTEIQTNRHVIEEGVSDNITVSKSLNTVLESIYNSLAGQNLLLDTTNNANDKTYSTDGSKISYKTDSFQLLHILQFTFLLVYYFLFCIILYYFYALNINFYAKLAMLIILFFYPFYIYNVQYYIYLIGETIKAYLLPNVLTQ
jgi:hypothetical protein